MYKEPKMSITSPNLFVENYNLKWDSHLAYLNMSLASNLKNDRFADVMLMSSHPESQGLPVIPAHKIILSSCSHFFSSILYNQPGKQNIMYIVLPPELSYRAIKILVQYMYCGQSTVSKDIVNEVLRGGELLKIRGLCKNVSNKHQRSNHHSTNNESRSRSDSSSSSSIRNMLKTPSPMPSTSTGLNHTQTSQDARLAESLLRKKTPVIVKHKHRRTPSQALLALPPLPVIEKHSVPLAAIEKKPTSIPVSSVPIPTSAPAQITDKISIKKDIAIDPDLTNHKASTTETSFQSCSSQASPFPCPDNNCIKCPSTSVPVTSTSAANPNAEEQTPPEGRGVDETKKLLPPIKLTIINTEATSKSTKKAHYESKLATEALDIPKLEIEIIPESEMLKEIKSEPIDWLMPSTASSSSNGEGLLTDIKSEGEENDENSDDDDLLDSFTPLACELCNEKFVLPKEWVRHIETHIDANAYVPKKKRRMVAVTTPTISSPRADVDYIAALKCDLCSTLYDSPADWVRHIQTAHTENELAFSNSMQDESSLSQKMNSRSPDKKKTTSFKKHFADFLNTCDTCGKVFPTASTMRIHMRTHINNNNND